MAYIERYQYASREHVICSLLWNTGMRSGTLRSYDTQDYDREDAALDAVPVPRKIRHRRMAPRVNE